MELAYRQDIRNIDRCLTWSGGIHRKQRKAFERYLNHANPRVKEYAQEIKSHTEKERLAWRALIYEDERQYEEMMERIYPNDQDLGALEDDLVPANIDRGGAFDTDIPF